MNKTQEVIKHKRITGVPYKIETENSTFVMERENDFPPNYNAQAGDNGAPGEQTEKDSTGDSELRQSPPAPPNAPGSDVSDEILIERSERPTRSRRVPDRLSYYAPGQACLVQTPYTVDSRPFLTNQPIIVRFPFNQVIPPFMHPSIPYITSSCRESIPNAVPVIRL